jgi:hemolysin III
MKLKEPLSGFLHLIGAFLAIPALIVLIVTGQESVWKIVSFSIYGASMFLLYLFSTLYHWLPKEAGGKNQVFRKLDHLAIYLLIAGTYTPFCLNTLRGPWGWSIFGVVWGLAVVGMAIQGVFINVWRWLTTTVYVVMGWVIVIALKPLLANLSWNGFLLLLGGGVIYSIGGVIYTIKKPNLFKNFGYHELWHIFVLGGSICHFLALLFYVAPM